MTTDEKPRYDLVERTAKFAEDVIVFARKIPQNPINNPIITQFVKSGTSVGANYCEADCAETKKDFEHKIGICIKEAKETKYWLRIIAKAVLEFRDESRILWKEAHELNLIFSTIRKKSKSSITGH